VWSIDSIAVFRRRRSASRVSDDVADARRVFEDVVGSVEDAKRALVAAVPRGRGAGTPLAEAVAGFESGLRHARERMNDWRVGAVEDQWTACRDALGESLRRSERLRLDASPEGYEELAPIMAELMEPLEAFERAVDAFDHLGA
jgi:hypothetical protein